MDWFGISGLAIFGGLMLGGGLAVCVDFCKTNGLCCFQRGGEESRPLLSAVEPVPVPAPVPVNKPQDHNWETAL